jgi:hypothetical protein
MRSSGSLLARLQSSWAAIARWWLSGWASFTSKVVPHRVRPGHDRVGRRHRRLEGGVLTRTVGGPQVGEEVRGGRVIAGGRSSSSPWRRRWAAQIGSACGSARRAESEWRASRMGQGYARARGVRRCMPTDGGPALPGAPRRPRLARGGGALGATVTANMGTDRANRARQGGTRRPSSRCDPAAAVGRRAGPRRRSWRGALAVHPGHVTIGLAAIAALGTPSEAPPGRAGTRSGTPDRRR